MSKSFKIEKAKKKAKSGLFSSFFPSQKFRRRGKEYIEKSLYAIDSPGEFAGITVQGWKAARRKKKKRKTRRR